MNTALYIAKRYLFSAKSKNAVNIITAISVFGVAIGTLALIVVLSVFNGFESLIKNQYHQVNSDFVVSSLNEKSFNSENYNLEQLQNITSWKSIVQVYEEKVLLKHDDSEQIATLRGLYQWPELDSLAIEKHIFKGRSFRDYEDGNWAIIGQSLAYTLSISVAQIGSPIQMFVPNVRAKNTSLSEKPFLEKQINAAGIYTVQADYDAAYVMTNLSGVQEFVNKPDYITSLEFNVDSEADYEDIQHKLQDFFGENYTVKNRFQQQEFLYKVLQTEKWAIFFILTFILLIATFNIVASVIMIVLEKRKDISSLWALGAPEKTIQQIFFYEGLLITSLGGGLGLVLGVGLCLVQQQYGIIQLGEQGAFIVNAYPVELQWLDVALIMATVLCIGVLLTYIPVKLLKRNFIQTTS